MSSRNVKKNIEIGSHYLSFFALRNLLKLVYIFTRQGNSSSDQVKCIFIRGGHRLIFLI